MFEVDLASPDPTDFSAGATTPQLSQRKTSNFFPRSGSTPLTDDFPSPNDLFGRRPQSSPGVARYSPSVNSPNSGYGRLNSPSGVNNGRETRFSSFGTTGLGFAGPLFGSTVNTPRLANLNEALFSQLDTWDLTSSFNNFNFDLESNPLGKSLQGSLMGSQVIQSHPQSVQPSTLLSQMSTSQSNLSIPQSSQSNLSIPQSSQSNLSIPQSSQSNLSVPHSQSNLGVPQSNQSNLSIPQNIQNMSIHSFSSNTTDLFSSSTSKTGISGILSPDTSMISPDTSGVISPTSPPITPMWKLNLDHSSSHLNNYDEFFSEEMIEETKPKKENIYMKRVNNPSFVPFVPDEKQIRQEALGRWKARAELRAKEVKEEPVKEIKTKSQKPIKRTLQRPTLIYSDRYKHLQHEQADSKVEEPPRVSLPKAHNIDVSASTFGTSVTYSTRKYSEDYCSTFYKRNQHGYMFIKEPTNSLKVNSKGAKSWVQLNIKLPSRSKGKYSRPLVKKLKVDIKQLPVWKPINLNNACGKKVVRRMTR